MTQALNRNFQEAVKKNGLLEQEAVAMIWNAVMSAVEWNKKEDLLQEQVEFVILCILKES